MSISSIQIDKKCYNYPGFSYISEFRIFHGRRTLKNIKALLIITLIVIAIMACSTQTTEPATSPTSSTTTINLTLSSYQDHYSLSATTVGPTVTVPPTHDETDVPTTSPTQTFSPPILTTIPLPSTYTYPSGMTPTTAPYRYMYTVTLSTNEDLILDMSATERSIFYLITESGMDVHPAFYQISGQTLTMTAEYLSLHQLGTYIYYLGTDQGVIQIDLSFVGQ
jgi:hypothetical protein